MWKPWKKKKKFGNPVPEERIVSECLPNLSEEEADQVLSEYQMNKKNRKRFGKYVAQQQSK